MGHSHSNEFLLRVFWYDGMTLTFNQKPLTTAAGEQDRQNFQVLQDKTVLEQTDDSVPILFAFSRRQAKHMFHFLKRRREHLVTIADVFRI